MTRVHFATSNDHKFKEAELVLRDLGIHLERLPSKGAELQADDVAAVASYSAKEAYAVNRVPLVVEDTGLFIERLGGFPGPYGAYAYKTIGVEGLLKLLASPGQRRAEFVSAVAFASGHGAPKVFRGSIRGVIAGAPRGRNGFGFDPVFVPSGSRLTLAQLQLAEKCAISHRGAAFSAFGSWLRSSRAR